MTQGKRTARSLVEKILGARNVEQATADLFSTPKQGVMTTLFLARNFRELHVNDAQVRVWLPKKADIALRETADAADQAVAEWMRAFLVAYLYGEHELARMRRTASGLYYVPPPAAESATYHSPFFSRSARPPYAEPLGKNMYPLKVFVPGQLKAAMQAQADKAGKRLSDFVRGLLIERLLGAEVRRESQPSWNRKSCKTRKNGKPKLNDAMRFVLPIPSTGRAVQ